MAGEFAFIRKYKSPKAFRNRIVTYKGRPFRIASASNGQLHLRWSIWIHPNDDALNYEIQQDGVERLKLRIKQEKERFDGTDGFVIPSAAEAHFIRGLEEALRLVTNTEPICYARSTLPAFILGDQ